jgi:hypothetical protein
MLAPEIVRASGSDKPGAFGATAFRELRPSLPEPSCSPLVLQMMVAVAHRAGRRAALGIHSCGQARRPASADGIGR